MAMAIARTVGLCKASLVFVHSISMLGFFKTRTGTVTFQIFNFTLKAAASDLLPEGNALRNLQELEELMIEGFGAPSNSHIDIFSAAAQLAAGR